MDAQTRRTITGTAHAGDALPGSQSVTSVPRTGPTTWPREAAGLRIPRHHAGACGSQQWIVTDTLR